jgi:DNA-binding transcriptional MerR regulator/methylmalonyl-CoA mutase cobalamin-binding subunit
MGERLYRIHVVAQMVGLSENLLRAWERRYGVLEPRRTAGGYRAYTAVDVELLRRVKRLTQEGVSIGDVKPLLPDLRREAKAAVQAGPADDGAEGPQGDAGDRLEQWSRGILDAAAASSQEKVEAVLDEALGSLPAATVVEELLLPTMREVGQRWHEGLLSVAQEHLVTHAVRTRLLTLLHGAPTGTRGHALCACFPDEDHELGLLAAAFRFRQGGFRVTYLGPRTPFEHLGAMAARLKPDVVALSQVGRLPARDFKKLLGGAQAAAGKAVLLVGGAGAEEHAALITEAGARVASLSEWARLLA